MIYTSLSNGDLIRQGDIFVGIPRFDFNLSKFPILVEDHPEEASWKDVVKEGKPVAALVGVVPVTAIVISQDCDNLRAPDINLCEIREFRDVERKCKETKKPKSWVKIITQQARLNHKWFYLPPNETLGFKEKMGVDFFVTLRIPREDLEDLRDLRKGRLNDVACDHFRERISEFYRRYAYDEWYPLNKEEMTFYKKDYPDAEYYPWQQK